MVNLDIWPETAALMIPVEDALGEVRFMIFTPPPLRGVGVLFSRMVSGWVGGLPEKFIRPVSQKL